MTLEVADELEYLKQVAGVAGVDVPEFVLPESRQVLLGSMRFHYVDWGTAGELPIVFLHGGALSSRTWDLVCLALREDYHCIALDQRGHGESEWSPVVDYSIEAYVGDLERFIDHLGFDRFLLVGMSLGAVVTASYAARHSDLLAGVVIVDAGPDIKTGGGQRIRDFVDTTKELDSLDEAVEKAIAFNPRRDPALLKRSLLNNMRQNPSGKWVRKNDTRHMTPERFTSLIADVKAHWSGVADISCPALVVRGAESDVFDDEGAESLAAALPDGRWVKIEGAGHTVQGDNPRDLVTAMKEFFREIGV